VKNIRGTYRLNFFLSFLANSQYQDTHQDIISLLWTILEQLYQTKYLSDLDHHFVPRIYPFFQKLNLYFSGMMAV